MDLPIVMHEPVTFNSRLQSLFSLAIWIALTLYFWTARAVVEGIANRTLPLIPHGWIDYGYLFGLLVLFLLVAPFRLRDLLAIDRTWTIDETAITVRTRYMAGRDARTWPLRRVTKVRVHDVANDDGPIHYCVEIQLAGRWKTVRCYLAWTQAWDFRNLIDGVLRAQL